MKLTSISLIPFLLFFLGFISLIQNGEPQAAIISLFFGLASFVAGIVPVTERMIFGELA